MHRGRFRWRRVGNDRGEGAVAFRGLGSVVSYIADRSLVGGAGGCWLGAGHMIDRRSVWRDRAVLLRHFIRYVSPMI